MRPKATTSPWVKALVIALVVGVVVAVAAVVILVVGIGKASKTVTSALTPVPGRPAGYHGPAYPAMLTQDHVAGGAGSPLNWMGETVTVGNLTRTASLLGPTLCSAVTVTNHAATPQDVGQDQWKLQQPNGIIETFAITGTLPGGQVVPGGTARGTVCFADTGQSGTFLLLWQPLFQVGRGVWMLPT